jgi:hypothetical protein
VAEMKGIFHHGHISSKKYILNYVYHNYNDKTGFYKNRIGSSSGEHEQQNMNRWKCEKCSNHFARFKQLKQHKGEYHAY